MNSLKTNQELWDAIRKNYYFKNPEWVLTNKDYYFQMLGDVYPAYVVGSLFAMGEADTYTKEGFLVFAWFYEKNGNYYSKLAAFPILKNGNFSAFIKELISNV